MLPKREYLIKILLDHGIIDSGKKIKNEEIFLELLFSIFLGWVCHERIKYFWEKDYLEETVIKEKYRKIVPFFHLPFHFIGMGDRTVFISDKTAKDKIFHEHIIDHLIDSYEDIHHFRNLSKMYDLKNEAIYSNHDCKRQENQVFCPDCKIGFEKELLKVHKDFFASINIKGYLILEIPTSLIKEFISEDELIEEEALDKCVKCKKVIVPNYWRYCPICGEQIANIEKEISSPREKVFNELLSIYFEYKHNLSSSRANKYFYKNQHEIDILLQKENKSMLIEGTTTIDLKKEYIDKKISTLLLFDKIYDSTNHLILWSLDVNCASSQNKDYISVFGEGEFILLEPCLKDQILNKKMIGIEQDELTMLKLEFDNIINSLNEYIVQFLFN